MAGLATASAITIYCAVWILLAWPNGSATAAFAALITCSFATQDDPAPQLGRYLGATLSTFPLAALYLFVIGRCLWIAIDARDTYSRLLAGALGLSFFVYVIVNGGMISGLLPVVGVPMPLLSYGGTSAVSLLAGLGLVMAVRAHRPVHGY